ncbi:hypothetical protein E2562_026809 [Oryza meyeriana var. granulata]|uniref:Uncharacterized protein n=1 Tax=Oryza meyeriana var. granulata TaxID=110450 RepID=A0A6G1CKC2_9ORYZ|nr:hypothetical protein E2562_026809 [Oryza meyeriana var. granulata]
METHVVKSQLYEPVEELPPLRVRDLFYSSNANQEMVREVLAKLTETVRNSKAVVINTFDELEPAELERIRHELSDDDVAIVFAAGPLHKLIPYMNVGSSLILRPDRSCLEWLDTQTTGSVLYVSFGSLMSLESDEFLEVALGLESSDQPFLWVVRPDLVRGLDRASLPDGFEHVVENRGKPALPWDESSLLREQTPFRSTFALGREADIVIFAINTHSTVSAVSTCAIAARCTWSRLFGCAGALGWVHC